MCHVLRGSSHVSLDKERPIESSEIGITPIVFEKQNKPGDWFAQKTTGALRVSLANRLVPRRLAPCTGCSRFRQATFLRASAELKRGASKWSHTDGFQAPANRPDRFRRKHEMGTPCFSGYLLSFWGVPPERQTQMDCPLSLQKLIHFPEGRAFLLDLCFPHEASSTPTRETLILPGSLKWDHGEPLEGSSTGDLHVPFMVARLEKWNWTPPTPLPLIMVGDGKPKWGGA